jgi:IS5 family transposase
MYRKRSGVEATNSVLARKFGIKHLRLRGLQKVSSVSAFKALALNIWRTAAYVRKKTR